MKSDFTDLILFPVIMLWICLLTGCSQEDDYDCSNIKKHYAYVSAEEKELFPYKGYDTIVFKVSSGHIVHFYGSGIDSGSFVKSYSLNDHCHATDYHYNQFFVVHFTSPDYTGKLDFYIKKEYDGGSTYLMAKFNYSYYTVGAGAFKLPPPHPAFYDYDSLEINGRTYRYIQSCSNNDGSIQDDFVLLNREFGLLKIHTEDGETWERVP